MSPSGRLGFHRASFPGMDDDDMYDSNRGMRNFLVYGARHDAGLRRRVIDTPRRLDLGADARRSCWPAR